MSLLDRVSPDILSEIETYAEFEDSLCNFESDGLNIGFPLSFLRENKIQYSSASLIRIISDFSYLFPFHTQFYGDLVSKIEIDPYLITEYNKFTYYLYLRGIIKKEQILHFKIDETLSIEKIEQKILPSSILYNIINDNLDAFVDQYASNDKIFMELTSISSTGFMISDISHVNLSLLAGAIKIFKYLLLNGAILDEYSPAFAVRGGNEEIIQMLVGKGIDFSKYNHEAIAYHQNEIATWIQENFDYDRATLHFCLSKHNTRMFLQLLSQGKSINDERIDLLVVSTLNGTIPILKLMISEGVFINSLTRKHTIILMFAVSYGYDYVVEFLCKNGSNVNFSNDKGITPLHLAALKGQLNIIKILLQYGANINSKDSTGKTPLKIARGECKEFLSNYIRMNPNTP